MFASIAIYGYSDHRMDIAIEFTSKNHSRTYITLKVCQYDYSNHRMDITKRVAHLNSKT